MIPAELPRLPILPHFLPCPSVVDMVSAQLGPGDNAIVKLTGRKLREGGTLLIEASLR